MNRNKNIILVFLAFVIIACKDYYNETIEWTDNLESELSIKDIQNRQPDYVEIDWENPIIMDNQKWYFITKIRGNKDVLAMSNYLVFIEDKYQYRESKK